MVQTIGFQSENGGVAIPLFTPAVCFKIFPLQNILTKRRMKCGLVADFVFAIILMILLFIAGHYASLLTT